MSFQPLPDIVLDPFSTVSLTGNDANTGVYLDADADNSSVLIQTNKTAALYIDKFQNMGINTVSPAAQLDVNSASSSHIQLTYNGSSTNKARIGVTSDGKLALAAGGSEVNIDTTSNLNVKSHNGSTAGLMLGNALVLSSADQLNYNVVTPGTASNSKAVVLNSNGSIAGINSLSATTLTGTIQTAAQPNITSVSTLNVADHNGTTGLALAGSIVTATAEQIDYTNTTQGLATASKAIILDANRDITNINSITSSHLVGTIDTAAQPNITSVGTLTGLNLSGDITGLDNLSINTTETGRALIVNNETGNCVRLYNDAATGTTKYVDMLVDTSGNLGLTSSGGDVDITTHDGAIQGLKLGGVLVTAAADQINYLEGTTPGSATAGKALIVDTNRNINNINSITSDLITGTIQTASQPNITSVNALNVATHDGSTVGLRLNNVLVSSTAAELNYVDTTPGTAAASKALVLDANKDIESINSLSATDLTGTIQTATQPHITSLGELTSLAVAGDITIGDTTLGASELSVLEDVVPGTVSASKAVVVDANKDADGIRNLVATNLTGTIQTAAQPHIASVDALDISTHDGETVGLALGGSLVTSNATELNYVDTVPGAAAATKAVILDANKDISGIHTLSATNLTGTLQTAAQQNITSVGTLTSLAVVGDVTVGSTVFSESELAVLDGVIPGTVSASKALVVDANKDISTIHNLSATGVSATNLTGTNITGTLQTGAQPNITSVSTLDITGHNGTNAGLKLGGTLLTATADQLNSIFGAGGQGAFTNLTVSDTLTLTNHDGTSKGLVLGSTLMTADAADLNRLDNTTPGTVTASKAVVVDANKDISSFRNLTATNLTGTIQTVAQPNITSVGTLTSIATSGNLTMGSTVISPSEIAVLDGVTPGTAAASKAVVLNSDGSITTGINALSVKALTLLPANIDYLGTSLSSTSTGTVLASNRRHVAYSPTLNMSLVSSRIDSSELNIMYTVSDPALGFSSKYTISPNALTISLVWNASLSQFVLYYLISRAYTSLGAKGALYYITSSNGTTWSAEQNTGINVNEGTCVKYHSPSNTWVHFATNRFYFSSNGISSWTTLSHDNSYGTGQGDIYDQTSIVFVGNYAINNGPTAGQRAIYFWNGTTWTFYLNDTLAGELVYHPVEDRLYLFALHPVTGAATGSLIIKTVETASTVLPNQWSAQFAANQITIPNINPLGYVKVAYHTNYDIILTGSAHNTYGTNYQYVGRVLRIKNKAITFELNDSVALSGTRYGLGDANLSYVNNAGTLIIPANTASVTKYVLYSIPSGLSNGITFGSTVITENELAVVDSVTAGAAQASKALVLDTSKNISGIGSLSAIGLAASTITLGTTAINESEISVIDAVVAGTAANSKALVLNSSGAISGITSLSSTTLTAGTALVVGSTNISQSEIAVIDAVVAGTAAASKAVVLDASSNTTGINSLTATGLTTTTLTLGSTVLNAAELSVVDGVTPGTILPSKAVVVDGNKDVSSFRNLTAVSLTSTSGSLTMGATNISENDILVVDNITPGTASASKALVIDANKDIGGIHELSASFLTSTTLTLGTSAITEIEIAVLDGVSPGTASASKALVLDSSKHITGISAITTDSLVSTTLTLGTTAISETEIGVLDAVVPGTVSASKAIVVDANKDISSFRNLTAINLTGTIQTASQPHITSVSTLDITDHDGTTQGLKLGGVLLTATADQINSIFGAGGEGSFTNLSVNDTLTIPNHDGSTMGLKLGNTLITAMGSELNYVDTTPGHAQASKALVFDANRDIDNIHSLIAANLTGEIQTASQPKITSVSELDITSHDGTTQGLKLGGVLLTATATQLNSIFGAGGDASFSSITLDGVLITASATELNYLDGSTPGFATAGNALVTDGANNIAGIISLTADNLIGEIQTAAQPNITSLGALTSLTVGSTTFSELELSALDGITSGTADANKAVVLDANKDITGIRHLTATALSGEIQTAAQPNITSLGELVSLDVDGDVNIGGSLVVGGTFISEAEVGYIDAATPGTAVANKAMVTNGQNSIAGINSLSATSLTGTIQTASQPNITSVSTLDIADHDGSSTGLSLDGVLVIASATELNYVDTTPGSAQASKALIFDSNKNIVGINDLTSATGSFTSTGQSITAAGDVSIAKDLSVGGVSTLDSATVVSTTDSSSASTGSLTTAGGVGIAKNLSVGANVSIAGSTTLTSTTNSTSPSTGALLVSGGVGVSKSLHVALDVGIGGDLSVNGQTSFSGDVVGISTTDSTSATSGALVVAGGVGIAKDLYVGEDIFGSGNLSVGGSTTQTGAFVSTNISDSTSTSTGAITTAGGVGIAKNATIGGIATITNSSASTSSTTGALVVAGGAGIGGDLHIGGTLAVSGSMNLDGGFTAPNIILTADPDTGALFEIKTDAGYTANSSDLGYKWHSGSTPSVNGDELMTLAADAFTLNTVGHITDLTQSTDSDTGAFIVDGGVGIAKNANIGGTLAVVGNASVDGTLVSHGLFQVSNATESSSTTTGSLTTAGGVGIAKNLNVGGNTIITGTASVVGTLTQSGIASFANTTDSSSISTGAITTTGGVGIAKNATIGGVVAITNSSASTSSTTGALVVAGGVGIGSDLHIGGDAVFQGDTHLIGDLNLDGKFKSTNVHLIPDASSPFTTDPLTTIEDTDSGLSLNHDAGIGYIAHADAFVVVPSAPTPQSIAQYSTNGLQSTWTSLELTGAALASYSSQTIKINQISVGKWSGVIWLAGSFNSTAIVLKGTLSTGIDTLYEVGSGEVVSIATATDDHNVAIVKLDGGLHYLDTQVGSPAFALVSSGPFKTVSWLAGLGKFVATRDAASATYTSTDITGSTWIAGTTPAATAPNAAFFNTTLNLAVAVGDQFIWYSNNGTTWTNGTHAALASGDKFNVVVNSPSSGLVAIYSNTLNSVKQLYYSHDAINWIVVSLSDTFGYTKLVSTSVAFDTANYAYAIGSSALIQRVGPITSASMVYEMDVNSGYLTNSSALGFKWYSSTTEVDEGELLITADGSSFAVNTLIEVSNSTNSSSVSTGAITSAGGVGIAKNLNVGGDVAISGSITVSGATTQTGAFSVANITDSSSPTTGAITTAGGIGIAKNLYVGANTVLGNSLSVSGATTHIGTLVVANATDSTSPTDGSIATAGGVGIAKSLHVGTSVAIGTNLSVSGSVDVIGSQIVRSATDSTSASTGAITTAGGVGISKSLVVGTNAGIGGNLVISGTSSLTGAVSVSSATDATSHLLGGSFTTAGGAAIAKKLFVGSDTHVGGAFGVSGVSTFGDDVVISSTSANSFTTAGGATIDKDLHVVLSATIGGDLTTTGTIVISDATDATDAATGSFKTAGGVGIAKKLYVGDGIYGTIQTASQPNITSVASLNITSHDGSTVGLRLDGVLITSTAAELNYLDGSLPGTAVQNKALVFDGNKDISGINSLSATSITGTIQTASQPNITSVSTLDITAHDGSDGLRLGGVLLTATAADLNSLVNGTSSGTFTDATITGDLTLSGHDGASTGLILGSTLVTATGNELNYLDTTPGTAEAHKALVVDGNLNIAGIDSLSANVLTGTIQTASQPNITSVATLNITGHNGTSAGLSLGGTLVVASGAELNYVKTTKGTAEANKALVLDASLNIAGINSLSATSITGTLQTAAQPNITSVGTLTSASVAGDLTIGSTVISETDIAKIDAITNGIAAAGKALVLDASRNINNINKIDVSTLAIGSPAHSDLPLEVGSVSFQFGGAYAYSNSSNAHGITDAGQGTLANYSMRADGRILVTGEVQITSDRRMKKNIEVLTPELSKRFVFDTTPVRFQFITGDDQTDYGYIAQDVLRAGFDDLVTVAPEPGMTGSVEDDGFINPDNAKFVLSPGKIVPLLALNQREVFNHVAELEARIARLEELLTKK